MRKRNKAITIRLTEEELKLLRSRIKESGLSLQQYILNAALYGSIIKDRAGTTVKQFITGQKQAVCLLMLFTDLDKIMYEIQYERGDKTIFNTFITWLI